MPTPAGALVPLSSTPVPKPRLQREVGATELVSRKLPGMVPDRYGSGRDLRPGARFASLSIVLDLVYDMVVPGHRASGVGVEWGAAGIAKEGGLGQMMGQDKGRTEISNLLSVTRGMRA